MRAVFDTNILIDYLNGLPQAASEIARYQEPVISIISWMEVMAGAKGSPFEMLVRSFLRNFDVQDITTEIAETAVDIRVSGKLKLPDAVILATARVNNCHLVTRNTKDFPSRGPDIRVPYRI